MEFPDLNEIGDKVKTWQQEETRHYLALPRKNYILSAIAFLGIVTTFLPWGDVTVGFYARALAVGLHFFKGWLVFLVFVAIIASLLFNKYLKLEDFVVARVLSLGSYLSVGLTLLFIIWHTFNVQYGAYVCLGISVIFLLSVRFYDKIMLSK